MAGASSSKHFAHVYLCKGGFVSPNAPNVIAVAKFEVSDIRNDGVTQSDVIASTAYFDVIRPELEFEASQLVLYTDTNNMSTVDGLRVNFDLSLVTRQ